MTIKEPARLFLLSLLVLSVSSCAAMFDGTSCDVMFDSNPPGAIVVFDEEDEEVHTTPFTIDLSKSQKVVKFTHPAHPAAEIDIDRSFQGGYLLLDILFTPGYGLVGILVDGPTSAFYDHPPLVNYDFVTGKVVAGGSLSEPEPSLEEEGSSTETQLTQLGSAQP